MIKKHLAKVSASVKRKYGLFHKNRPIHHLLSVCLHARVSWVTKPAYGVLFSRIECILLVVISIDLTSQLQL